MLVFDYGPSCMTFPCSDPVSREEFDEFCRQVADHPNLKNVSDRIQVPFLMALHDSYANACIAQAEWRGT